jgi:sulfite reductase (NADPH) hemoprotein beta-component
MNPIEKIKIDSHGLRGTLKESLEDEHTGAVRVPDEALIKFHGMYQQDDRDQREERARKKLENLFSFMIRLRIPGGFMTAGQWVAAHHVAGKYSTGIIKITTRQTIQLHGILKRHIKPVIKDFDLAKLDSIAACGDVNRNVLCSANPNLTPIHKTVHAYADKISTMLLPKTRAYYEVWLDEKKILGRDETDPLYQDRYLPRKFKVAIAIPPDNEVDVFANDIGLIAIIENSQLIGFNLAVGGGLSATHGNPNTYPRLATVIGFVGGEEKTMKAVYETLAIQRDFGNRDDRKLARLKYTLDKMGVSKFKAELEERCGFALDGPKTFAFTKRADDYGWRQDQNGNWHFTLFVEHGRVTDLGGFDGEVADGIKLKSGMLAIAETGLSNFRFTANQHVIIADVSPKDKSTIDALLVQYKFHEHNDRSSATRKDSIACVSFNTCPLALAEAQRYLPKLIGKIDPLLEKYRLQSEGITIRMTGCPNGCGRSTLAEIGFIGTAYGRYNMHLGGDHLGNRLNKKYKENLNEQEILSELDLLFARFVKDRKRGQRFGDFVWDNIRLKG